MINRRVILNFHGLGDIPKNIDNSERPYWISIDKFEKIIDHVMLRKRLGHDIKITFDDGNHSDISIAVPCLRDRGLTAKFFLLTGRIESKGYLSKEDIKLLIDNDMEVGLHWRDHLDWRNLATDALNVQIPKAQIELSCLTGYSVRDLSIPFGAYNRRVMSFLSRMNFQTIFTSDGGFARQGAQVQPRFTIQADTEMDEIIRLLDGETNIRESLNRKFKYFVKRYVV